MAEKTSLSELRNKLQIHSGEIQGRKGGSRTGSKANKPSQVTRDIKKNFRKTV